MDVTVTPKPLENGRITPIFKYNHREAIWNLRKLR